MSKKTTSHHKYLVALTFDEKENDKRIVVKLEKTDVDEFCMIFDNDIYYYFSLAQFNRAMKAINNGDE